MQAKATFWKPSLAKRSVVRRKAGTYVSRYQADSSLLLARYLSDGLPDPSFGSGGVVQNGTGFNELGALVLQPDGRPIVVGSGTQSGGTALIRFDPDGALDTTFGNRGVVEAPNTSTAVTGSPKAALLQANGRLLVGVSAGGYALIRYQSNGAVDASFNGSGILLLGRGVGFVTDIAPLMEE